MTKFNTMSLSSPVQEREYVWVGEYLDGTLFSEFNLETAELNDFYAIQKDNLKNFGLIGNGQKVFYNTNNGAFNINGDIYNFTYEVNNKKYYLSFQEDTMYNDIIQFKKSVADFNPFGDKGGSKKGNIIGYNFGYKVELLIDNIKFNFKVIYKIEEAQKPYFNINLVSNKNLDGRIIIEKNNQKVFVENAALKENIGGTINWIKK